MICQSNHEKYEFNQSLQYFKIRHCPKITKDTSLEIRVQTPDASTAPRREGWNVRLNITAITKTQILKAAPQHHCSTKTQESKLASLLHCNGQDAEIEICVSVIHEYLDAEPEARVLHEAWRRTWSARFSSVTSTTKCEARSLRLGYNCPHY